MLDTFSRREACNLGDSDSLLRPKLRFALLGELRAFRDDVELANLGPPQQQAVLLVLLMHAPHALPMARLVDALWEKSPPRSAVQTVRTYVWRLRSLLGSAGAPADELVSVGDGYRLDVRPSEMDIGFVEDVHGAASEARVDGRPDHTATRLDMALSMWRGEPLIGVPGPFCDRQRDRFSELRISLVEQRAEIHLENAEFAVAVAFLGDFAVMHPLRESLQGLLIRALYGAGRQADALAAFHATRVRLAEGLGVDPSPELTSLYQGILQGRPSRRVTGESPALPEVGDRRSGELLDTDAIPSGPAGRPGSGVEKFVPTGTRRIATSGDVGPTPSQLLPLTILPQRPNRRMYDSKNVHNAASRVPPRASLDATITPAQLPADLSDLVGRDGEICELCSVMGEQGRRVPAVAGIYGMSGVGKTSLAVHVAHQVRKYYPDGQLYAQFDSSLNSQDAIRKVLSELLSGLGFRMADMPDGVAKGSRILRSLLDGRSLLMVLDDVPDAARVRDLIPGSAGCGVIVTSRSQPVGLPLTCRLRLDVLTPESSLTLLGSDIGAERLAAQRDQALAVLESCGRLPLAIRIVGARLARRPDWPLSTMAERLGEESRTLAELQVGHVSISDTFELGYRKLTEAQAHAMRVLASTGSGELTVADAAAALSLDTLTTEDLLDGLVDASMLEPSLPGRYRLHTVMRVFARCRAGVRREALGTPGPGAAR